MRFKTGEVWFASFPLEENKDKFTNRPVVVIDEMEPWVIAVKITKHEVRIDDSFDTPIIHWSDAGLHLASTARTSKFEYLRESDFIFKIGELDQKDLVDILKQFVEFVKTNILTNNNSNE